MREIKFRAFYELGKMMHYDFQFIKSGDKGNDWIIFTSDKQPLESNWRENPFFSRQFKIMQYSGYKCKNAFCEKTDEDIKKMEEIYEGDFLFIPSVETESVLDDGSGPTYDTCQEVEVIFKDGIFGCEMLSDNIFIKGFYPLSELFDEVEGIELGGNKFQEPECIEE